MPRLLHDLLLHTATLNPQAVALRQGAQRWTYAELATAVEYAARGLNALGLGRDERVAIFLEKRPESVVALFAASAAGGIAVPINPQLRPAQVRHVVKDSGASVLVTSGVRYQELKDALQACTHLRHALLTEPRSDQTEPSLPAIRPWGDWPTGGCCPQRIETDLAALLYTSGSTGRPKGVVLNHRNLVTGAESVSEYLENTAEDRILCVLPLSFDYGLSQLTTALAVGAEAVLLNHLLARDVVCAVARHGITGLAAVPPLWVELAQLDWPAEAASNLRYFTNSGGALPTSALAKLRARLPGARPFLMYGLTEAFRSTYLPPEEIDQRPGSMGRAIPNAEIGVVRPDGSPCMPLEPGELVHRGPLVSQGYWNAPEATAARFRPAPGRPAQAPLAELAVWSGDTVYADADGFLYFVGRRDEMIKTSGFRVSPLEIEEVLDGLPGLGEHAALGIPDDRLGEAIALVGQTAGATPEQILTRCRERLPAYMVPTQIRLQTAPLPRNANGKIDRAGLRQTLNANPPAAGERS
ncbi:MULTISPECIES: acyl-CoA ligase (AMP-forming), exosortase A system-associated [unclassified Halorhodospira]|uniref:acyl-CoA ligase (AMP-forming), exosortase A system-associated n=1 Tax=unclassified Halorhodospira TaxID=2626748 RepID=UPI001EE9311B|nr:MULTISPECIES: acyl-CoA ligase (AMP-forming), exosortase A system-associated [unclassified Halorhodospira]MCG5540156.1 acyl-CoA ligase (AMP-forming), exosortase A system-associated [Halorhodospira sp. M39old]MCG5545143.1 acyl-CoA ligase (AMP-forming), exosortase A system-associated [Halorhodospira sp. M38]